MLQIKGHKALCCWDESCTAMTNIDCDKKTLPVIKLLCASRYIRLRVTVSFADFQKPFTPLSEEPFQRMIRHLQVPDKEKVSKDSGLAKKKKQGSFNTGYCNLPNDPNINTVFKANQYSSSSYGGPSRKRQGFLQEILRDPKNPATLPLNAL